ncbi:hypothetical protein IPL85_01690 [Candidatus Saccharibacteria bacterium]|nr:MAG: hypothetical protein IPL85_01690 [Candidatus Saccharibacteria bacterium]
MNETLRAGLGIASGLLMILCVVPYIRDILRRTTKPERATWWVWLGLGVMSVIAQFQAGSRWSLLMTVGSVTGCGAIAFFSLKYGYGHFKKQDTATLIVAALGMVLSQVLHSPLIALLIIVFVDMVGCSLTIVKTWEAPQTETLSTWVMATAAGLLGALSVSNPNLTKLVYPLYIFIGNFIMIAIIYHRRRALVSNLSSS